MSSCGTCHVVFSGVEAMRAHYGSELHLTNVRRRVDGLRPLTAEQLRQDGGEGEAGGDGAAPMFTCTLCKKTFHSVQTLQTHVRSTAHLIRKEQRILARDSDAASMLTTTSLGSAAVGLHRRHNAKLRGAAKDVAAGRHGGKPNARGDDATAPTQADRDEDVSETRCLFCGHPSTDVEANLAHLARVHEFVIPMRAHCTDVAGLLAYLARKVNGLLCIVCGERSRGFASLDAVRHHMRECGHEKIVLGAEYGEFYDCALSDFDADSRVKFDGVVRGERGEELLVLAPHAKDGAAKRLLRRREADVPLPRHRESEQQALSRKAILAADHESQAVARREQRELMAERHHEDAALVRRQGNQFHEHQLKVSMRSNKLHPKGYDGNGVFA